MYEKLDKLRAELGKAKQRRAEADAKVKQLEQKLKEAENSQILAEVGALKLTPEQLAQFLQMAAAGQLGVVQPAALQESIMTEQETEDDYEESEDFEDEEN